MTNPPPAIDDTGAPKKRYETPRLEVYGDVGRITQTVSNMGMMDGGHGAHGRTG
jgi:hypothetical protein